MDQEKIGKELLQRINPQSFNYYCGSKRIIVDRISDLQLDENPFEKGNFDGYTYCAKGYGNFFTPINDNISTSDDLMQFEVKMNIENDDIESIDTRIDLRPLRPAY